MEIIIKPIGIVKSNYVDPEDSVQHDLYEGPEGEAVIEIFQEFKNGLMNIDKFYSHIFVIYWMHRIKEEDRKILVYRPYNNPKWPLIGVFGYNTPKRPNPIAITPCRIIKVDENKIFVKGLDALNGSPVLDIKPYRPHTYVVKNPKVAPWTHVHHKREYKDEFEGWEDSV